MHFAFQSSWSWIQATEQSFPFSYKRSQNVTPYRLDTDWHISHKLTPHLYPHVTSHPKKAKWKLCNWYNIRNTLVFILQERATYCTPSHNPTKERKFIFDFKQSTKHLSLCSKPYPSFNIKQVPPSWGVQNFL